MSDAPKPQTNLPAVISRGRQGLELITLEDTFRFAKFVIASGIAPKGMEKPETILIAIQAGAEIGLPPMAAIQSIAVINGRASLWGDCQVGVIRASGMFDEEVYAEWYTGTFPNDDYTAHCRMGRKGSKQPIEREFSNGDAKRAGLIGKAGPWQQYPKRMLMWRARGWCARDGFNDVLKGMITVEEALDIEPVRTVKAEFVERGAAPLAKKLAEQFPEHVGEPEPHGEEEPAAPEPETPPGATVPEPGTGSAPSSDLPREVPLTYLDELQPGERVCVTGTVDRVDVVFHFERKSQQIKVSHAGQSRYVYLEKESRPRNMKDGVVITLFGVHLRPDDAARYYVADSIEVVE